MLRVTLRSWTASFRYPTFQSGTQPTLQVPPISTVLGILSAARGDIVQLKDIDFIGYVFKSEGQGWDLERIYPLGKTETDILKREILFNNTLYLYLPDAWEKYFKKPKYQLLLGRSLDLATVDEIKHINLKEIENPPLRGTLLPLKTGVPGIVHALPVEFDYSRIPRVPTIVKPFIIVPYQSQYRRVLYPGKLLYDEEIGSGVYLYDASMFSKD